MRSIKYEVIKMQSGKDVGQQSDKLKVEQFDRDELRKTADEMQAKIAARQPNTNSIDQDELRQKANAMQARIAVNQERAAKNLTKRNSTEQFSRDELRQAAGEMQAKIAARQPNTNSFDQDDLRQKANAMQSKIAANQERSAKNLTKGGGDTTDPGGLQVPATNPSNEALPISNDFLQTHRELTTQVDESNVYTSEQGSYDDEPSANKKRGIRRSIGKMLTKATGTQKKINENGDSVRRSLTKGLLHRAKSTKRSVGKMLTKATGTQKKFHEDDEYVRRSLAKGLLHRAKGIPKAIKKANTKENRDNAAQKIGYGVAGTAAILATSGMAIPAYIAYKNRKGIKDMATRAKDSIKHGITKVKENRPVIKIRRKGPSNKG